MQLVKHLADPFRGFHRGFHANRISQRKHHGQADLCLQFGDRTAGHGDKAGVIARGGTSVAFGNVRRNRYGSSLQLRTQAIPLFLREFRSQGIDCLGEIHRQSPDIQLPEVARAQTDFPRFPVPGPRSRIDATNLSNSGARSCGPGLASGWPWKLKAGASVSSMPWLVPSNSERWVTRAFAGSVASSMQKPWFCEVISTRPESRSCTGWLAPWWPCGIFMVRAPTARPSSWWPRQMPYS